MIRRICFLLSFVVVTAALFGCAGLAPDSKEVVAAPGDNEALVNNIQIRLFNDPVTSRMKLGLAADDGIVTVTGRIDNPSARLRAISVVRSTPGVRGVIDKTYQF